MSRAEQFEEAAPDFEALLNYLTDATVAPESYGGVSQSEADQKRKGKYEEHMMPIYNGRAVVNRLSLEREGFVLVNHDTQVKNFYDEAEVRSVYYAETEELV
ncbi:MAG TPA: methyltransferase, partial [Candidatus Binatia bacterium]